MWSQFLLYDYKKNESINVLEVVYFALDIQARNFPSSGGSQLKTYNPKGKQPFNPDCTCSLSLADSAASPGPQQEVKMKPHSCLEGSDWQKAGYA